MRKSMRYSVTPTPPRGDNEEEFKEKADEIEERYGKDGKKSEDSSGKEKEQGNNGKEKSRSDNCGSSEFGSDDSREKRKRRRSSSKRRRRNTVAFFRAFVGGQSFLLRISSWSLSFTASPVINRCCLVLGGASGCVESCARIC